MHPAEYFPKSYRSDLQVFTKGAIPDHGPYWMLCGMTLGRLFEQGQPERYADPVAFLYVLYELNLIHQGIYKYFRGDYPRWLEVSDPFPDLRGCPSHHGGVFTPDSLIRFAKDPSYVPRAKSLDFQDEQGQEFTCFFFGTYLRNLCESAPFSRFMSSELVELLKADPHCVKFSKYAEGNFR